jgi:hypothetical protein
MGKVAAGHAGDVVRAMAAAAPGPIVWEDRMNEPVPARIPQADGAADEVRLRAQAPRLPGQVRAVIAEAVRVLKPGGRVFVHVLTGERSVANPNLPGRGGRFVPSRPSPTRWRCWRTWA